MGRKRKNVWRWRIVAVLLLAAMAGGAWGWWEGRHWVPSRAEFPVQGALVGEQDGEVDFDALAATGAGFVYLEASHGADGRDASFGRNLAALDGSALPHGAVHAYDPCVPAERQAANFVTIVPRDPALLPPVIALDQPASECGDPIVEAGLESELTTFINQVETHSGQPVVVRISRRFEQRYAIASGIERNLWLTRDWWQPDYGGRPWTLWTANSRLMTENAEAPLRWVVVQP